MPLVTNACDRYKPRALELAEFPLNSAGSGIRERDDLVRIKAPARVSKENSQNSLLDLGKRASPTLVVGAAILF